MISTIKYWPKWQYADFLQQLSRSMSVVFIVCIWKYPSATYYTFQIGCVMHQSNVKCQYTHMYMLIVTMFSFLYSHFLKVHWGAHRCSWIKSYESLFSHLCADISSSLKGAGWPNSVYLLGIIQTPRFPELQLHLPWGFYCIHIMPAWWGEQEKFLIVQLWWLPPLLALLVVTSEK